MVANEEGCFRKPKRLALAVGKIDGARTMSSCSGSHLARSGIPVKQITLSLTLMKTFAHLRTLRWTKGIVIQEPDVDKDGYKSSKASVHHKAVLGKYGMTDQRQGCVNHALGGTREEAKKRNNRGDTSSESIWVRHPMSQRKERRIT